MAAAGPHFLQLTGVPQGLVVVIERAEQQQPPLQEFVARSVRVGEAGGFLALLSLEIEAGVALGGHILNRAPLESVDRVAHLVTVFKDNVLPQLRREPTKAALLRIVQGCARALRADALAAGGSFNTSVRAFAGQLEQFLEQAHGHPLYSPYAELRAAVDELRRRAANLLQATCTIRHQAMADGAAEAGQGAAEEVEALHDDAAAQAAEAAAAAAQEAAAEAEEEIEA
jgi:hypothetical protein